MSDDYLNEKQVREWLAKEEETEFDAQRYMRMTLKCYEDLMEMVNESKN